MARGILLVLSKPKSPEVDQDYNDWYDNVHLPEILALAGFKSARRFSMSDSQLASQGGYASVSTRFPSHYVAVYEVEADDVNTAVQSLTDAGPTLNQGKAFDYDSALAVFFEEITSR